MVDWQAANRGRVLLEAVWRDEEHTKLGLAFGTPDGTYERYLRGEDAKDRIARME